MPDRHRNAVASSPLRTSAVWRCVPEIVKLLTALHAERGTPSCSPKRGVKLIGQVEKLLSNPDREVALPQPTKEKTLRAPQELVKNVQPTASAAGSGEFHVYKHARRREAERLKIMDDKAKEVRTQLRYSPRACCDKGDGNLHAVVVATVFVAIS